MKKTALTVETALCPIRAIGSATGSACCTPGTVLGWRLDRNRWRQFHVVGSNIEKTNISSNTGQEEEKTFLLHEEHSLDSFNEKAFLIRWINGPLRTKGLGIIEEWMQIRTLGLLQT